MGSLKLLLAADRRVDMKEAFQPEFFGRRVRKRVKRLYRGLAENSRRERGEEEGKEREVKRRFLNFRSL